MAEFVPGNHDSRNCDGPVTGVPHPSFDYILRSTTNDDEDYSEWNPCPRYLQVNGKFDNLQVTSNVTASTFNGNINVQSWKGFDIKHPNTCSAMCCAASNVASDIGCGCQLC